MMIDQPSSSNSNSRGCLSGNNKGEPCQTPHLARLPAYRRYDAYPRLTTMDSGGNLRLSPSCC